MTKTWTWTAKNGNEVKVTYDSSDKGTLVNSAGEHKVNRPVKVQGKPCIGFMLNGKGAWQLVPQNIYDAIIAAEREDYREVNPLEAKAADLKKAWDKVKNNPNSLTDEITARDAYYKVLDEWKKSQS